MTESNPPSRRLGYACVSTYWQTLDAQLEQLRVDGCAKVYRERASGARADRRQLLRLPGDLDAGGRFRSLAEPWADASNSTRRPMIGVVGGPADVERDLIRTRTEEGGNRANARGQRISRPPKLTPQQQAEARRRRDEGTTLKERARSHNVGIATVSRPAT